MPHKRHIIVRDQERVKARTMAGSTLDTFEEDNKFFKNLLDMVPARVLFDEDMKRKVRGEEEDDEEMQGDPHKKKKGAKKKPNRVDPLLKKTVTQLQEELDEREGQSLTQIKKKKKKKNKNKPGEKLGSITHDLEQLRGRLQARIAELTGKKTKLTPEEFKEKTRLMKKNKKLKMKMNRSQKQNRNKGQHGQMSNAEDSSSQTEPLMVSDKPVYNKEGKLVFSKFDFTDSGDTDKPKTDLKGKNYKRLLEKLEKRKKKVSEVREKNVETAEKLEEKAKWKTVLLKAEGEKVKDNEQLLKKAAKRKEKDKKKKKKSWESRTQQVDQEKKKKQEKRKQNLDARKKQKMDKKKKKFVKKGHLIPGF